MPISATGPCSRQRGFTLLELLVTLLIIGIILSFALLSVGDGGRDARLREEARRLAALVELASEEAVLQSRELGLQLYRGTYRFVSLEGEDWQALPADELLRERSLPEGLRIELFLEEEPQPLSEAHDEAITPQLLFLSSGERTPFALQLHDDFAEGEGSPGYRISGGLLGPLSLQAQQEGTW